MGIVLSLTHIHVCFCSGEVNVFKATKSFSISSMLKGGMNYSNAIYKNNSNCAQIFDLENIMVCLKRCTELQLFSSFGS